MILQVIYKFSHVDFTLTAVLSETVQIYAGREHFCGRNVSLVVFNVFLVVSAQAVPGGCVEEERHDLEEDGHADVQVPVAHVVIEQTGASVPAFGAPEKARGIDPRAKYQRRRNEPWKMVYVSFEICILICLNIY